jgi:hypothetical protein
MAKKTKKNPAKRASGGRSSSRESESVASMVDEVREPFSLLNTLKEEGLANAMALFGLAGAVASGATKNLRIEALKPALYELINSMGFALREDLEKLEARIEELEAQLSAREYAALGGEEE